MQQSLEQRRCCRRRRCARAHSWRSRGLCVRALQVSSRRGHRVHAAVVPLRAAVARAAAALTLFPAARAHRHLYRPHLGLSADRAAADPVDRARLFRGYLSGHRARLSRCRSFVVAQAFTRIAVPLAGPGIAAAGLLSFIFCWNNFVFALDFRVGRRSSRSRWAHSPL